MSHQETHFCYRLWALLLYIAWGGLSRQRSSSSYWPVQLGQTGLSSLGRDITFDSAGNVFAGGSTSGNLTTCFGISANCTGTATGTFDYYISKYTSEGAWQWTRQLGQAGLAAQAFSMATDPSGNVYIAGPHNS